MNNPGISKEALSILKGYAWPGNVRELSNTIHKALISTVGRLYHRRISHKSSMRGIQAREESRNKMGIHSAVGSPYACFTDKRPSF